MTKKHARNPSFWDLIRGNNEIKHKHFKKRKKKRKESAPSHTPIPNPMQKECL